MIFIFELISQNHTIKRYYLNIFTIKFIKLWTNKSYLSKKKHKKTKNKWYKFTFLIDFYRNLKCSNEMGHSLGEIYDYMIAFDGNTKNK